MLKKRAFSRTRNQKQIFVVSALAWVNKQWPHDGMNEPAGDFTALDILKEVHTSNARYRCVEYGQVLSEVLQAYGFVTRGLSLRSKDVAYGGFGQGHVAMEVWLNDIGKWIFLDPQFGVYLSRSKSQDPLNYHEIYLEKKANRWGDLIVNFSADDQIKKSSDKTSYKKFLKRYFGLISVSGLNRNESTALLLETKNLPLTFQGAPSGGVIATTDAKLFYPEMNRVALFLDYRTEKINFQKLLQELGVKTDADYKEKMPLFAAKPEFIVNIKSNSKLKESFLYRLDRKGEWHETKGSSFVWDAPNAKNILEVRSKNEFGRLGPVTFMEIRYQ